MNLKNSFCLLFMMFNTLKSCGQKPSSWSISELDSIKNCVDYKINTLKNKELLMPFLNKLYDLKNGSNNNAVIVHLGDSHIQADMMTNVIRTEFQNYFGNAGRGLVFPYQLAKSNAPSDLIFTSDNVWKSNRITKKDSIPVCGIAGFGLQAMNENPSFLFNFRVINEQKQSFDRINFFLGTNISKLAIDYKDSDNQTIENPKTFETIDFKSEISGFKIAFQAKDSLQFFGASLEKSKAKGIIYHSIGANGAKYSDYDKTALFWEQLPQLKADCYIISLGTNEAQDLNLSAENFILQIKTMTDKIKIASPNAVIILTTPPVSYFKKSKPNPELVVLSKAIIDYCSQNNMVFWDLFNISEASNGAKSWKKAKLLRPDLVHFSKEGYVLQGNLFAKAFANSWNEFLLTKD